MNTFIISNDSERIAKTKEQLLKLGITNSEVCYATPPPEGFKSSNTLFAGEAGCLSSHIKALIGSGDHTAVFEEDVHILREVSLTEEIAKLPEDWKILFIGCLPQSPVEELQDGLYALGETHSSHAYVVNKTHVETLAKLMVDSLWKDHPDCCVDKIIGTGSGRYSLFPNAASQFPGISEIRKSYRDYDSTFEVQWAKFATKSSRQIRVVAHGELPEYFHRFKRTWEDYAERVGAELLISYEPTTDVYPGPAWHKIEELRRFAAQASPGDKVLVLDYDVAISPEAMDVFNESDGTLAMVPDSYCNRCSGKKSWEEYSEKSPADLYFNTGVILSGKASIDHLMSSIEGEEFEDHDEFLEQHWLNLMITHLMIPVLALDVCFNSNRLIDGRSDFTHYCGKRAKKMLEQGDKVRQQVEQKEQEAVELLKKLGYQIA